LTAFTKPPLFQTRFSSKLIHPPSSRISFLSKQAFLKHLPFPKHIQHGLSQAAFLFTEVNRQQILFGSQEL
jgi:hypothetical protein